MTRIRSHARNPILDVINDVIDTVENIVEAPVRETISAVKGVVNGRSARRRPRSGVPHVDGLVGIEANPGPANLPRRRKLPIGAHNQSRHPGSRNNLVVSGSANNSSVSRRVSRPIAVGSVSTKASFNGRGSQTVLGSQAHVFTGRCAVQNLQTITDSTFRFRDANGNTSAFIYLNPRICCQNAVYNTPAGMCPIGVIAQPFRKFSFRRLKLVYEPTSVATTMVGTVACAFDPEAIATFSMGATVMNFANFEASRYGPIWSGWTLDVTPFLDRSRWYFSETPVTIGTSILTPNCIQGTLMLAPVAGPAADTIYGMFHFEFELALSELGPTEVFSLPAALPPAGGKDEEKSAAAAQTPRADEKETVAPSYGIVRSLLNVRK